MSKLRLGKSEDERDHAGKDREERISGCASYGDWRLPEMWKREYTQL